MYCFIYLFIFASLWLYQKLEVLLHWVIPTCHVLSQEMPETLTLPFFLWFPINRTCNGHFPFIIMESLPAELKLYIVELSSGSPNTLAALARTHTAYQREAEKALYNALVIFASTENSLKCMETLATNSEKAALVHFLTVEYEFKLDACGSVTKNRMLKVTTYLSKSLPDMHSLSDFRVRSRPGEVEAEMIRGLGEILWSVCKILICSKSNDPAGRYSQGHFRLQTLYCEDAFDISLIIKSQTDLHILGLYSPCVGHPTYVPAIILKALKELHNAQLFLPIVLMLERISFYSVCGHISIFPAYYAVDRRATIHQALAQSFNNDKGVYRLQVTKADDIRELSIYLIDSSDMPSVYALVKDMVVSFPQISWLNLWFERRCEIVSLLLSVDDCSHRT